MEFQEGIIPDYIWKFVRGIIKNPITAGILAYMIWSYVKKNTKKTESFTDIPENADDKTLLGIGIIAEQDAINLYQQIAKTTSNEKIRKLFLDIAKEEKTHIGEFQALLKLIDKEYSNELKNGANEIKQKLESLKIFESYNKTDLLSLVTDLEEGKTQSTINKFKSKIIKINELDKLFKDMEEIFKMYDVYDKFKILIPKIKKIIEERKKYKFSKEEYGKKLYNYIHSGKNVEYDSFITLKTIKQILGKEFNNLDKNDISLIKKISKDNNFLYKYNLKINTENGKYLWKISLKNKKESFVERLTDTYEPFKQSDDESEKILSEMKNFIDKINKYAVLKIDFNNSPKRWLSKRIFEQQDNPLWKHLSSNKKILKHFKLSSMDPTEGIFMVDIDFLIKHKGNKTGGLGKENNIRKAFENNIKLPTPQYWLPANNLGEGNHRVMVAKELGFKSIPVRVYWK